MIIFTLVAARGVQQEEVKDEDAMLLKMIILMLLWCRVAVMSAVSPLAYIINMCAQTYEAQNRSLARLAGWLTLTDTRSYIALFLGYNH